MSFGRNPLPRSVFLVPVSAEISTPLSARSSRLLLPNHPHPQPAIATAAAFSGPPPPPYSPRPRSNTADNTPRRRRPFTRARSGNPAVMSAPGRSPPSSPPPYSITPPTQHVSTGVPARRTASSPHLRAPPTVQFYASSSRVSAPAPPFPLARTTDTSDDEDTAETAIYTGSTTTFSGTLRARVLGKGKDRMDDARARFITTVPGIVGAGETETEGEDSPRNLPTARITRPALTNITIPFPATLAVFIPSLFSFSRLLSIVPAVIGTLYNTFCLLMLTENTLARRVDYFIAILWSILTGWQCLQLTTGLLKRWRVYYSPLPTLIRLFALQAICWPATHFTLQLLGHEQRPALCWAVVGTTTCWSRSIQLWVTSNIVLAPPAAPASAAAAEEWMKMGRRRRWDWGAVGRQCALPAGAVYFVMAWADMLVREWARGACPCA